MKYILWSGGFDSTYLLCKRARECEEIIQPVYMVYYQHPHCDYERAAQAELLPLIRSKTGCKAQINTPIEFAAENIATPAGYDEIYERWKDQIPMEIFYAAAKLGDQYPGIEIGIEGPAPGFRPNDIGRVHQFLLDNGLELDENGKIDPNVGNEDLLKILGGLAFPIITTNTLQEWDSYVSWGWEDIALKTRTCGAPLEHECGVCNSCSIKWRYGDAFRFLFDKVAQQDHDIMLWIKEKHPEWEEYWVNYVTSGHYLIIRKVWKTDAEKSRAFLKYFDELEKSFPNLEEVDAPAY